MARKYYRKSRPRRQRKGKGRGRRSGNKVLKVPGTFAPQHMITTLKYLNTLGKSAPANKIALFNQFRLNSIWDPDYTNTLGTSCLGVAQWRNFYQRYRVFRCAYKLTFSNLSADSVLTGAVVPANYLDTTFSMSDYMRPLAKRFEIGNREGSNKTVVRGVINLPKLAGVSPVQYRTDVNNQAGFSANPANPLYISVIVDNSNPSLVANIVCQIELTYTVELMATEAGAEALVVATGNAVVPEANFCTAGYNAADKGITLIG